MSTRFHRVKALTPVVALLLALLFVTASISADSISIDFESYTVGNINGQDGWMKTGPYDAAIVNQSSYSLSYPGFGNRSLRISNAVTSGSFGDQTFSKPLTDEAGETSAQNGGMSGGTRQTYFEAQWDFASTVPGAEQPGLSTVASPDRGDGARMSWIQMTDTPTGLAVNFNDYDRDLDPTCTTGAGFVLSNVVSGLNRAVSHTLKVTMQFVDGPDNDIVKVYVDGILEHTGQSWEDYFRDCEGNPTRTVDSILFRVGGTAAPATAGQGFLIDNLSLYSGPVPVVLCTTICYVDDAAGSDAANGGTSMADAFKTIQKGIDTVTPGGQVIVNQGTYPESPNIHKSLTLTGEDGRNVTTIDLQSGPTYLGSLTISGAEVTVEGFTIEGFNAVGAGLANTNVQLTNAPDDVLLKDNRFKVGQVGGGSNGDDGIGLLTAYNTSSDVGLLRVEGNEFMPLNTSAFRAFYINPGVDVFEFVDNTITGNFTASSYTQAKDGLVEDNTLTGTGTSRGLGTWGYPDPTVYGATLFQGNTISDVVNGISILGSENVTVMKNVFTGNDRAVYVAEDDPFDLSTIHINRNSIDGNTMGIENWYQTEIDGTCNWWGDASGPGPVGPGSGDPVSANVDYTPWLYTSDLSGPCYVGGTITIDKVAAGGGATQFEFDVSWSATNVMLTDAGAPYVTTPPLMADSYSIQEVNLTTGWSLQSAKCDNTTTTPVETVNPSNITVADGDAWVCTFTNIYTPPPTSTCPAAAATHNWTDLLGIGMGSPKSHKVQAKLVIPNNTNLVELYGQLVAKSTGLSKYVRFIQPGKNNYVEVNTITSPAENINGNFWYGANLPVTAATKSVTGKWWLQKSGTKGHIPRAFILYPTYSDPANTYVNVWDTYDASEGEVYWDVAQGWTPVREIVVPIAAPLGATTLHVEIALVDNEKDARPVWVTVTAGGVTQTQKPTAPNKGDQLNLLVFDLANVPAGTAEIVVEVYSPAPYAETGVGALGGDSATVVGLAANYRCAPIN